MTTLAAVLDFAHTVWLVAQAVLAMTVLAATAAITYAAITATRWGGAR
ncbi:hypothetical protein G6W47_04920 [Streptomyces sp. CAI-21]|nr:hypothetical protein [Streptomyces sp. CAI-21]